MMWVHGALVEIAARAKDTSGNGEPVLRSPDCIVIWLLQPYRTPLA